jgi:ankyrin repeat protein
LYLKCAVEEGKPDAVQLCLDQGATVNCQFKDDLYTPLHTACSATPADDSSDGDNSKSASSIQGSMQVLELLLEKGADGNACNKWRETPLLIAANNGHRAAVEALLDHDADPSLCSEAGWSALTFAAHKVRCHCHCH